jgi:hypothetical protein
MLLAEDEAVIRGYDQKLYAGRLTPGRSRPPRRLPGGGATAEILDR